MNNSPFNPGTRGWDALRLVRESSGSSGSAAHRRYYASMIHLREQVCGEVWSAEAYVAEGKYRLMDGEIEKAVGAFQQAMLLGTPDRDVLYLLGAAWNELGEYSRAEWLLSILIADVPDHAKGHFMLSRIYRELGRWDEVATSLKKAVEADPTHADACYGLANCFNFGGGEEARLTAVDLYRKAIASEPHHEGALTNLGQLLIRLGKLDEAKTVHDILLRVCEIQADMLRSDMESDARNFSLLCGTVGTFKAKYGVWPDSITMWPFLMQILKNRLAPDDFELLSSKVELIEVRQEQTDVRLIMAEGSSGQQVGYSADAPAKEDLDLLPEVEKWLGAQPLAEW